MARAAAVSGASPSSSRRAHRALGRFVHRLVPRAPELVHGELDHERHRLGRALVGQVLEGAREAVAGLLVPSEEALHPGTGAGEPGAQCVGVVGHDRDGLQQGAVAVGETAGRRQRPRAGEEELDALLRRRGLREEAQCLCEPVCGACRREPDGFLAGLAQDGGGADVALARRALDVVGARRRCSPSRRERLGAALVGAEPPAAGGGLVDRPAHERMPEAEAPGHVGRGEGDRAAGARRLPPSPRPRASGPRPPPARARRDRLPPPLLPARGVRRRTAARAPR